MQDALTKKVSFITMGCAKNEVDTQRMRSRVIGAGYLVTTDPACADAIVVNTCSFIQAATEESLEALFDATLLPKVASGEAHLIVAGCMPARYGSDLEEELVEVAAFLPCAQEDDIVEVLNKILGITHAKRPFKLDDPASAENEQKVSAYVKISDGCDRFCSYCAIPLIRGRYHSFTLESIQAEVQALVGDGVREIVLIAQDTGRWGEDFEQPSNLAGLLSTLAQCYPETWFRLMYLQPEGVSDQLLETLARYDNICSYFDIPLQHVNERLLRAMNRRGSEVAYKKLIERIRSRIPEATLRTTLIAGFPGESDSEFEQLCEFIQEADFDYIGVFAYSREEGTHAYDLPGQINEDEKADRAQQLRDLSDAVCIPRMAARVGKTYEVLVEGVEEDGQRFGRARCQAPEVDGVTYVSSGKIGEIVKVTIGDTLLYEMEGI